MKKLNLWNKRTILGGVAITVAGALAIVGLKAKADYKVESESYELDSLSSAALQTWTYSHTGGQQTFTAPADGYYELDLAGAQGASNLRGDGISVIETIPGGKGGRVVTTLFLSKGQTLYINVGGQGIASRGGYNGGGDPVDDTATSTASAEVMLFDGGGGGATTVATQSGQITDVPDSAFIAIAAGGGAAQDWNEGGAGGTNPVTTGTFKSTTYGGNGTAGGGAGYLGGAAGIRTIHYHIMGDGTRVGEGFTVPVSEYGNCFTTPVYHRHTSDCYYRIGSDELGCYVVRYWDTSDGDYEGHDYKYYEMSCGTTVHGTNSWHTHDVYTCGKDGDTIEGYTVGCGIAEGTITTDTASYGGTNYVKNDDNSVRETVMEAGTRSGNGFCTITKVPVIYFEYSEPYAGAYLGNTAVKSVYAKYDASVGKYYIEEYPVPISSAASFKGWGESTTSSTTLNTGDRLYVTGDTTLYSIWNSDKINVNLVDSLGIYEYTSQNITYEAGSDGTSTPVYTTVKSKGNAHFIQNVNETFSQLPTPSVTGYTFNGWYLESTFKTQIKSTTKCTYKADITLYAKWTCNTYKVTFNANGGTLSGVSSKNVQYGSTYGSLPTASKSGYIFEGWFTAASGGNGIISDTVMKTASNHTLYAHWVKAGEGYEFEYTGGWQTLTIPETGYYKVENWGAQGESYDVYSGGKGGYTNAVYYFEKGTVLNINVGGVNGYGGGGVKTVGTCNYTPASTYAPALSNGGGASAVYKNGKAKANLLTIAGGGGGATQMQDGGDGGLEPTGTSTFLQGQSGQAGGGGGYTGGSFGESVWHQHTDRNGTINNGLTTRVGGGGCFSPNEHQDWEIVGYHYEQVVDYECPWSNSTLGDWSPDTAGWTWVTICSCGNYSTRGPATGVAHIEYKSVKVDDWGWVKKGYWDRICNETIDKNVQAKGGSSKMLGGALYTYQEAGVRIGNGRVVITPLYELVLDLNKPTTSVADVNATNTPTVIAKSSLNRLDGYRTPIVNNTSSKYSILVEKGQKLSYIEWISELPQPTLKGWTFTGWYSQASYKTSGSSKVHSGKQLTIDTVYNPATYGHTSLLGNKLYAHWDENVYYIKYVANNTTNNIYNDECTSTATFGTGITPIGSQEFTKNTTDLSYTQKCLYDHEVQVLQNLFVKTGYFFDGWYTSSDRTDLTGANTTTSGTGKGKGTKYFECETLTPYANGEQFKTGKCNFAYITDPKQHETSVSIPKWSYTQSSVENGSDTVILYATWEPMRYVLMYDGNNNWNTSVKPYAQSVTSSTGAQTTAIRYDQYFNMTANKFTRNAPYTIKVGTYDVVLKNGYKMVGWGFGQNTFTYDKTTPWELMVMNSKAKDTQGLLERDYVNKQTNVRNVLSPASIQKMNQYLLEWNNSKTVANISNKTSLHSKTVQQNIYALWRRVADSSDEPGPDGDLPPSGDGDSGGPDGGNPPIGSGGTDSDPDDDDHKGCDNDCDCENGDSSDPYDDDKTGCTCKDPENPDYDDDDDCKCGDDCDCCKDKEEDVTNGDDSVDPTDDDNDTDFGLTIKFDLNGGKYIRSDGSVLDGIHYIKMENFNQYYVDFDVVGNTNKDLLNRTAKFDIYGYYSNSNSAKNWSATTGLNTAYQKTGADGTEYRLIGWSLNKRASKPDINIVLDGCTNNLNVYDSSHNTTIRLYNDTTFYAVWEPVLKMNVNFYRKAGELPFADGTYAPSKASNVTAYSGAGKVGAIIKPGEAGRYIVTTRGMNKLRVQVTFDTLINDMYDNMTVGCSFYDVLNTVTADDVGTLLSDDQSSNLNRLFTMAKGTQMKQFYVPQYLGTKKSYITSIGVDKYAVQFKATQESFFWSYVKGGTETAVVNGVIYLKDTSATDGGNGPGDDGGGDPDDGGGSGGSGDDGGSDSTKNTLGEFKTRIRM